MCSVFTDPKIVKKTGGAIQICASYRFEDLRGTWTNEYVRFMPKSKSIDENRHRTPYKPPMEIMKIK